MDTHFTRPNQCLSSCYFSKSPYIWCKNQQRLAQQCLDDEDESTDIYIHIHIPYLIFTQNHTTYTWLGRMAVTSGGDARLPSCRAVEMACFTRMEMSWLATLWSERMDTMPCGSLSVPCWLRYLPQSQIWIKTPEKIITTFTCNINSNTRTWVNKPNAIFYIILVH